MARVKLEPTSAMGTDIPLAIYSQNHLSLFHYFKQLFAQVTNPPIDSLREEVVTDTTIYIGSDVRMGLLTSKTVQLPDLSWSRFPSLPI